MSENQEKTVLELMRVNELSESQQHEALEKFGNLIIEASVGQLLLSISEEKAEELKVYIENVNEEEDIFAYLLRTYPDFQSIVEKQVAALKTEIETLYK
jgi:hypothetical protein